jgi:hypothetical protein
MEDLDYNVLWLDDEWNTSEMEGYYHEYEVCKKEGNFENIKITKCTCKDEVIKYLKDDGKFQALILDVFGKKKDENCKPNADDFIELLRELKNKEIFIIGFSAEWHYKEGGDGKYVPDVAKEHEVEIVEKSAGTEKVLEKIDKYLGEKWYLYKPTPELKKLFDESWIDRRFKPRMDDILGNFNQIEKEGVKDVRGDMRLIFENMIEKLTEGENSEYYLIPKEGNYYKKSPITPITDKKDYYELKNEKSSKVKYLSFYRKNKMGQEEYYVEPGKCPVYIKYAIEYLNNTLNNGAHDVQESQDFLKSVYYAFILTMKWFAGYKMSPEPYTPPIKVPENVLKRR